MEIGAPGCKSHHTPPHPRHLDVFFHPAMKVALSANLRRQEPGLQEHRVQLAGCDMPVVTDLRASPEASPWSTRSAGAVRMQCTCSSCSSWSCASPPRPCSTGRHLHIVAFHFQHVHLHPGTPGERWPSCIADDITVLVVSMVCDDAIPQSLLSSLCSRTDMPQGSCGTERGTAAAWSP